MTTPPSHSKAIVRSDKGSIELGGFRYRFARMGEKSCLYKLMEKRDNGETNSGSTKKSSKGNQSS
jgi:hypothetical protein